VTDVTALRRSQQALETAFREVQSLNEEFRLAVDTIPGLVWSTLPDGHADFLNQRWLEYTGLSLKEALGSGWKVAFHPDDYPTLDRWRASLAAGESFEAEARMRRVDGEYCWFLIRFVPLRDEKGNIVKWYGTNTDIQDRKRAEALLAGEKRLLEMIAKGNSLAVILDGLCRLVEELSSGSLASILLLDASDNRLRHGAAPGLPRSYIEAIDGSVIGPAAGSCGTAAYRREPVIVSDIATDPLWADYRELALPHGLRACWSTPIPSSDGRVLGTFAIYSDEPSSPTPQQQNIIEQVTDLASIAVERKHAEDALHHAQAELAHVTRVATLGEMTASIAHEINQPLAAVVNNASACLRWLAASNLEEARQSAALVVADGHRAGEIIGRIRALAKKAPPQKNWLDINATIREVIALASSELHRSGVALETKLSDDVYYVPLILADRIQLQQVILNLIINAIEAMSGAGDGPRELLIRSGTDESKRVLVTVRDSGPGLDPKSLNRLFDAFYTTKPHGLGMGLAICRSIVEAHGGRLWATASESRGAVFQFTLPTGGERTS
jgi:PAS domain S-box-containing protein